MANTIEEFWWQVNIPFNETVDWNVLVTAYEDGKEQRRKKWSQPKRSYEITLTGRQDTEMKQVWDFYNSRSGSFDTFYFTNSNESPISNEVLGTGDGTTQAYIFDNYPLPSGSPTAVSIGGTPTVAYTMNRADGTITFDVAPTSGDQILGSYNFCRVVRFAEDKLSRELFNYKLYNSGIRLLQVL